MNSQKLIANEISVISTQDSGSTVLGLMSEFRVSHLPIVENNKLIAIVSEDDIYNMNDESKRIESILEKLPFFSMSVENDVFEINQQY